MPVTAKLSRRFYEQLGDDVATELVDWFNSVDATYRGDLRELNELNYSRFHAGVRQLFSEAELRAERRFLAIEHRLDSLEARFNTEIPAIREDIRRLERRFDRFEQELDGILDRKLDQKLEQLEQRLEQKLDQKLENLERRFDQTLEKFEQRFDQKLETLDEKLTERLRLYATREEMDARFNGVELKIATLKADLLKWMFLFWCGSALTALLLR